MGELGDRIVAWSIAAVVATFCLVIVETFTALLLGLWERAIDNGSIFKILEHAFDLIMVSLTSFVAGSKLAGKRKPKQEAP